MIDSRSAIRLIGERRCPCKRSAGTMIDPSLWKGG